MPETVEAAVVATGVHFWRKWIAHPLFVAIAGAAATQLPTAYDWTWAKLNGTGNNSQQWIAGQQAKWAANNKCGKAAHIWHETDSSVEIDATICPGTGDILVALRDRRGKMTQGWPSLEKLQNDLSGSVGQNSASLFESAAYASITTLNQSRPKKSTTGQTQLAQQVACQVYVSERILKRRIVGPGSCVDEYIDTYTGQVIKTAPCTGSCP